MYMNYVCNSCEGEFEYDSSELIDDDGSLVVYCPFCGEAVREKEVDTFYEERKEIWKVLDESGFGRKKYGLSSS